MKHLFKIQAKSIVAFLVLIVVLCAACFKDEDTIIVVPPWKPGDPILYRLKHNAYNSQEYFHFEDTTVAGIDMTSWDLGFACNDTAFHIILNPATKSLAAEIGYNFDSLVSPASIPDDHWFWDKSDGNLDSLAIKGILDFTSNPPSPSGKVFLIDRGYTYDEETNITQHNRGYKKFQLAGLDGNQYIVRFADIDGGNEITVTVDKDPMSYYTHLSFDDGSVFTAEPQKENWHLLFTQYMGKTPDLQGVYHDYFVRGVILNNDLVSAIVIDSTNNDFLLNDPVLISCMDTSTYFKCIDYFMVESLVFSQKRDTIGHLWKDVSVNTETGDAYYECDTNRIHLIKTHEGDIFKLRFVGFYNNVGIKGYTTLEFQQL